jgi:hypothetical protein
MSLLLSKEAILVDLHLFFNLPDGKIQIRIYDHRLDFKVRVIFKHLDVRGRGFHFQGLSSSLL